MSRYIISMILMLTGLISVKNLNAQSLSLGNTIYISASAFNEDVDPGKLKKFINTEVNRTWPAIYPGTALHILQADRGAGKDDLLLVCTVDKNKDQNLSFPSEGPFSDEVFFRLGTLSLKPSTFLKDPEKFTKYWLIGSETIQTLPKVDLLGIHYIQVKKDKAKEFEHFVTDKLNPRLSTLLPEMGLFYYKAVDGDHIGSYITIFAIKSLSSREKFWPSGGGETEIIKKAFQPLNDLALELGTYLQEGSYLLPESGGAAAYFESLKWTDFVIMR